MTGKHTPGPWHRNIKPATKYTTVWSGRNKHVARVVVDGLAPEEVEANICLIAAAPELLDIAETIELGLKRGYTPAELLDENSPIRDRIRAVIAKTGDPQ